MKPEIWAAYEACEEYWYWGQTPGGERLFEAVSRLLLQRPKRMDPRRTTWA
jgi:hypothetical protein